MQLPQASHIDVNKNSSMDHGGRIGWSRPEKSPRKNWVLLIVVLTFITKMINIYLAVRIVLKWFVCVDLNQAEYFSGAKK